MSQTTDPTRPVATWQERWLALPGNLRGALWMLVSAFGFASMTVFIKFLGQGLDSLQVAFFRCFFGWLAILPFILLLPRVRLRTSAPTLHFVRGLFGALGMFCGYYAIAHMKLADFMALSFSRPLFTVLFAVLLLREAIGWRRWTAVAVGFLGVLVTMRPDLQGLDAASLIALCEAMCIAIASTLVKRVPIEETPLTILFWYGVIASTLTLGPALAVWQWPTQEQWLWLIAIGLLGAFAHFCWIRAFRAGQSSAVAPVDYVRLPLAGLIGWLIFAELPTLWSLVGAAIIVASTFYILRREARLAAAKRAEAIGEANLKS